MAACRRRNIMLVILGGFSGFAQRAKYGEEEEERGGNNAPPCSAVIKNVWIFCLPCTTWTKKALPPQFPSAAGRKFLPSLHSVSPTDRTRTHTHTQRRTAARRTDRDGGFHRERGVVRSESGRICQSTPKRESRQSNNQTAPPHQCLQDRSC